MEKRGDLLSQPSDGSTSQVISPGDKNIRFISTSATGKSCTINNIYEKIFLVACPELRQGWNAVSKWEKFTDERLEWEKFKRNISSNAFQSDILTFSTYFYDDPLLQSDCAWCGTKFSDNSHIFWEC